MSITNRVIHGFWTRFVGSSTVPSRTVNVPVPVPVPVLVSVLVLVLVLVPVPVLVSVLVLVPDRGFDRGFILVPILVLVTNRVSEKVRRPGRGNHPRSG